METILNSEKTRQELKSRLAKNNDADADIQKIFSNMKASDLPFEEANEFSDAPFEFEETAKWLWDDTRVTYYHAGIENRYSENYLRLCGRLEKNIRRLGSFCLNKAVMEQKGYDFPELKDLSILELVKMVSLHLRKCHAAFQGCYYDNNFLGMSYLNWEFRWFDLGNRLKATGVKIDKVLSGEIKADSLLEQTEKFKGEPRTNDRKENDIAHSLRVNPSALPLDGSLARDMLRAEKEQARAEAKAERESERGFRSGCYRSAAPFGPPKPFPVEKYPLNNRLYSDGDPSEGILQHHPGLEADPEEFDPEAERELLPGELTPEEARNRLLQDAKERGDREAMEVIPGEAIPELYERWVRYCDRVEQAARRIQARAGPDPGTRKKLREKRKKRR